MPAQEHPQAAQPRPVTLLLALPKWFLMMGERGEAVVSPPAAELGQASDFIVCALLSPCPRGGGGGVATHQVPLEAGGTLYLGIYGLYIQPTLLLCSLSDAGPAPCWVSCVWGVFGAGECALPPAQWGEQGGDKHQVPSTRASRVGPR